MPQPSGRFFPGVEQYHLALHPEDRPVLEAFAYAFDLTHAKRSISDSRAEATVVYLRPFSQQLEGLFGVGEQEILLFISPHGDWQARALDMHDGILAGERSRLDQRFSIIVSNDRAITRKIKDIVTRDLERSTSIGIPADALKRVSSEHDLIALFRDRLPMRDLFSIESPLVQDSLFFGREQVLADLTHRISAGQNSGLFGLRRIGKTSVLNAVQRRMDASHTATCVYRDSSSAYQLHWWSFLELLIRDTANLVGAGKTTRKKIGLEQPYTESTASSRFGEDIEALAGLARGGKLVMLIDEIEWITFDISPRADWNDDFLAMWTALRSVHQNSRGAVAYVLAGVNPYALERERVGRHDNPLFSTTRAYFLDPFDSGSTSEMVRRIGRMMGLRFQKELLDQLYREYGGHPFLTRRACSELARRKPDRPATVSREDFFAARDAINHDLEKNARQILTVLESWYPDEFELLVALAAGDSETFVEYARTDRNFVAHVEGYGLVQRADSEPRIRIGIVADYLTTSRARLGYGGNDASTGIPSQDEALAEISRRRNGIERALRERVRLGMQFAYGNKANARLLETLGTKRADALSGLAYREIWEELYFNELGAILSGHWNYFSSWLNVEKTEVERWMDHINRSRADAHAREISSDDLAYLRVCFARLETYCEISRGS